MPSYHKEVIGYVYVMQNGDRCKIGYSANPAQRLLAVRFDSGSRTDLVFQKKTKRPRGAEKTAHALLRGQRLAGEWFAVTPAEAIEAVKSGIANPADCLPCLRSDEAESVQERVRKHYERHRIPLTRGSKVGRSHPDLIFD